MTKKTGVRVLVGLGVMLLVVVTIHIVRHPWWPYCVRTAIDANSGTLARRTYVCDCKVRETVEETAFSREVSRLGITVDEGRHWRSAGGRYGYLIGDCKMITWAMDALGMPDAERSAILAETLAIIRAKDVDMMRISEIMTQLGKELSQVTERELNRQVKRRDAAGKTVKDDPTE